MGCRLSSDQSGSYALPIVRFDDPPFFVHILEDETR